MVGNLLCETYLTLETDIKIQYTKLVVHTVPRGSRCCILLQIACHHCGRALATKNVDCELEEYGLLCQFTLLICSPDVCRVPLILLSS